MGGVRRAASRRAKLTSGPMVARLFQRLLALAFLFAWLSLRSQAELLIGQRGLLPIEPFVSRLRATAGVSFWDFPTFFWWATSDAAIRIGIWVGIALSLARPRRLAAAALLRALDAPLPQLRRSSAARFLSLSSGTTCCSSAALLAVFLPRDRAARRGRTSLFRLLLFKLYFESGIAKWQSHLARLAGRQRDDLLLRDRAAADLARLVRARPARVVASLREPGHARLSSWCVPLAFFGPRPLRLAAALVFTAFQLVNVRHRQLRLLRATWRSCSTSSCSTMPGSFERNGEREARCVASACRSSTAPDESCVGAGPG